MSIHPFRPLESQSSSWTANCAFPVSKPPYPVFHSTLVSQLGAGAGVEHAKDNESCFAKCKAVLSCLYNLISCLFDLILGCFFETKEETLYLQAKSKIMFEEPKSSKPFKVPEGYEYVVGPELAREFMNSTTDASIIKQLAQAAHYYSPSPRMPKEYINKQLFLRDLVKAATPDQIEPLVEACRGRKYRTRALFSSLFNDFAPRTPSNKEENKTRLKKLRKAYELIVDDLQNIFVLNKIIDNENGRCFTNKLHEIDSIRLHSFLKWEKRLGLPTWLIQKCNDLLSYRDSIVPKADREDKIYH